MRDGRNTFGPRSNGKPVVVVDGESIEDPSGLVYGREVDVRRRRYPKLENGPRSVV